jgi:hypothetical protein
MTMMIEKLKRLNFDAMLDMDEAVEAAWIARCQAEEYEKHGMGVPEWLEKTMGAIQEEIERRMRAMDMARLKTLEIRLDSYKTPNERKKEDLVELANLQRKLGLVSASKTGGK